MVHTQVFTLNTLLTCGAIKKALVEGALASGELIERISLASIVVC